MKLSNDLNKIKNFITKIKLNEFKYKNSRKFY